MADDRIDLVDWCDVAAVGALARAAWHLAEVEDPVRFTLEEISSSVEVDGIADEVASALREAHEAGLREGRAELQERIDSALDMAGSRWSEWGDRAVAVAEILEGDK